MEVQELEKQIVFYDYIAQTSKPKKGTFFKIFVCYKTDEILYDDLKENLGDSIQFFKSIKDMPDVQDFPDEKDVDYKYKFLVIFDDCVTDKDSYSYKKVEEYFSFGRKKRITLAFLSQSFFDTDTFIRKQITYLILLSIKGKTDLTNILRQYASIGVSAEQLELMFNHATTSTSVEDEMPFFKVTTAKCPEDKKFSKDWLDYLNPNDFQPPDKKTKKGKYKDDPIDSDDDFNIDLNTISKSKKTK